MSENKWRFPASGHGERKGISSGDTEAFKKSPFQAFAREILQNSIDARDSNEEPTKVVFNVFEINTADIPGYIDLKNAIRRCKEFWAHKVDYVEEYDEMLRILECERITCLRVSDFNTTGLIGVETQEQNKNNFLALTKGTGVSEKSGSVAGGSKGVGKNAAFLMSNIRTVFYATKSNQDIQGNKGVFNGFIGVSELVSGYVDDNNVPYRDYTQGTGYYSNDDLNSAVKQIYSLDNNYTERERKFGTDIFIVGFLEGEDWEKEVINSVLDSFMSTIVRGELEIHFIDREISNRTIKELVYDESIIYKNNKSNIISQYRLLNGDEKVTAYDIDTEYGLCELYILPYPKEEEELATHKCVMIRHPLMKIKEESLGASFRVSAMCIIGEGTLGKLLRDIENPQHIDWEPKRIKDKFKRKEVENVIRSIREQIREKVIDCLQIGDEIPLDPNGAGDFLPDADFGDSSSETNGNKKQKPVEVVCVSKPKINKTIEKSANQKNDDGEGIEPDIGEISDEFDDDLNHPSGENDTNDGGYHPGPETSGQKDGERIIFKRSKLSGVRYKVISTNKNEGKLKIIFTAPIDFDTCYLNLFMLDDTNSSSAVDILEMNCNGNEIKSKDKKDFGPFRIRTNEKIVLYIKTNSYGYFGSEVKVICK